MGAALKDITVLDKIGYGSYSTVYRAREKIAPYKYLAVKIVEKAKLSARGKNDIIMEIQVMKMLKHKYVVEMKDFKWDEKNIYIIMEYCDGGDLSTFIRKRTRLPEKVCRKFLQQLAIGLQFLRSHNICHLDLKPQNLLIVTRPKISLKIGDFGFAQFLNDTVQDSSIRGSPLYMAPEMLLKKKYDVKADLWSVGVITYECLFGKAPYPSNTYNELYFKIKAKTPITIPSDTTLSEDCRDFISNLLVHDPENRMNYETFFNHPFLDLEHIPSQVSYEKAMNILKDAVHFDEASQYIEAFNRYCEGLRYLFPILNDETIEEKKIVLQNKVFQYTKRAEELKCKLEIHTDETDHPVSKKQIPLENSQNLTATKNDETDKFRSINSNKSIQFNEKPLEKNVLKELMSMCSNTPKLKTALEIGINAQLYLAEGKYDLALEKYRSSLGILLSSLNFEPNGIRKDLIYIQTKEWMRLAESTKSLLKIQENTETQPSVSEAKDTCLIQ